MRHVLQALVGRVGVDRRHQAVLDADGVVDHLRDRRQAVGRARGVGDDVVRVGVVVRVEVDAESDRHVRLRRRRRDDHLLRARVEVLLRVVPLGEEAGRLDHDVDAEVAPRQVGRIALLEDLDLLAVDRDRAAALGDLAGEPPEDRVVLQEVGEGRVVGDVVDRDDVEVRVRTRAPRGRGCARSARSR